MSRIDVDIMPLTDLEKDIVRGILHPTTGELRASKPKPPKMEQMVNPYSVREWDGMIYNYADDEGCRAGMSAYVWRMVAFQVSPNPKHHCMPVMAFCDVPGFWRGMERRELEAWGDRIVAVVVDAVPVGQWHGVRRWSKVLHG